MPIMILILLGTIEVGAAFKDYLTVSYTTREAARVGALAGDDVDADCYIKASIIGSIGTSNLPKMDRIEIFQADPATGDPVPGNTNTWKYTGTDPDDCTFLHWSIDENWPSTDRKTTFAPGSDLDIIGVRVIYTHNWLTGFPPFSGSFDLDEATITRLEPGSFE